MKMKIRIVNDLTDAEVQEMLNEIEMYNEQELKTVEHVFEHVENC